MEQKIQKLVSELTLDEKIGMIHGNGLFRTKAVERLGIPELTMSDGPMGVRKELQNSKWIPIGNTDDYVTYLPSNSALASTWNKELAYLTGKVLGEEARGRGKDVILAPGINIKRSPLCGRNFEYMSEDPYLTAEMAVPLIRGIQTADTAACVKHYAMNNKETKRHEVDVIVSNRALREIYLPAFERAVKEGNTYSLMGAYNRYKGDFCCENIVLLNEILREEWGYDGMVVSDWGGVANTKKAAESGLDIEMSVRDNFDDYYMANPLKEAIEQGEISEEFINKKVENILRLLFRLHKMGDGERNSGTYNTAENRNATLDIARESVVLLKNENNLLPLNPKMAKKVLVIGDNANRTHSDGGGSAEIKSLYEITPLMGIKKLLGGNAYVEYRKGYFADDIEDFVREDNWQASSMNHGGGFTGEIRKADEVLLAEQKRLREEAIAGIEEYDVVILVGGQNHKQDLEGQDRPSMKLPYGQDELISSLLKVRPDTIVVMASGSAVEMPWISAAKTLVWHWYAGMEGGTALAEVLFGSVNPSGKLPETFLYSADDCSAHCVGEFPGNKIVDYKEDIFVGYRYYDTFSKKVLFPFGYGLSYTEFVYNDLQIMNSYGEEGEKFTVSLDVTNIGKRSGKETIQIYVGKKDSKVERPLKELRGFEKVMLESGETRTVTIELDARSFQYYNEDEKNFVTESGMYEIYAGRNVKEICCKTVYMIK